MEIIYWLLSKNGTAKLGLVGGMKELSIRGLNSLMQLCLYFRPKRWQLSNIKKSKQDFNERCESNGIKFYCLLNIMSWMCFFSVKRIPVGFWKLVIKISVGWNISVNMLHGWSHSVMLIDDYKYPKRKLNGRKMPTPFRNTIHWLILQCMARGNTENTSTDDLAWSIFLLWSQFLLFYKL